MKLVIAQMKHETNTFSPVPTPLARFGVGGDPPEGAAAVAAYRGTGAALAAFMELAEQAGATYEVPIAAAAWPSGMIASKAPSRQPSSSISATAKPAAKWSPRAARCSPSWIP